MQRGRKKERQKIKHLDIPQVPKFVHTQLARRYGKVTIHYTGPFPPYDFVVQVKGKPVAGLLLKKRKWILNSLP